MEQKNCFGCKPYKDRVGILVAQLGTPTEPSAKALRPYLKQFLGDRRVIEKNRVLWWFILNVIILNLRPKRSAKLYKRIWTEQGSPLMLFTKQQTNGLRESLSNDLDCEVEFGMRYGEPSLEKALDSLIAKGCSKILLFNMYPHYSATTTASNYDAVFKHILKRRFVPTLKVIEPYYKHPSYLRALSTVINEHLGKIPFKPEKLVFSYHGIPEEYVEKGDPYCCQCTETTRSIKPLLDIDSADVIHTFQSRFGRDPWLVPYTDITIDELANQGVKKIAVACPGFVADCLETLDELGNEAREAFHELGGEDLYLIPCLNSHPAWINAMREIVLEELGTWANPKPATTCVTCPVQEAKARGVSSE